MVGTLIDLDDETYARVRLAARVAGISEAAVVARAIAAYLAPDSGPPVDRWEPIPVYAGYGGRRVEGVFTPATQRLVVTSEPLAGQGFKSPSGAARAVVRALNPDASTGNPNGWTFWRTVATGDRIEIFRRPRSDRAAPDQGAPGNDPERT